MNYAERLVRWNRWYDTAPEQWRFQLVLWPLLLLGAINMMLTIWAGVPFALLVVLGIIFLAVVRIPYGLGWVTPSEAAEDQARFQMHSAGWAVDLNRRYDAMPESRRFWVFPAVLVIAGAINMLLTIGNGFPFGLLFLLALLALVAIRAPYVAGWFGREEAHPVMPTSPEIEHRHTPEIASESPPAPPHGATDEAPAVNEVPERREEPGEHI